MVHLKHFFSNTKAKTNYGLVLVAVVIVAVAVIGMDRGWFGNISLPFSVSSNNGDSGSSVNRQVQFAFTDKYSGSALGTKTFYVYVGSPAVLKETLTTDSAGLAHTSQKYVSGTVLNVEYISSSSKVWYEVTVPTMTHDDAQSQTYNSIDMNAFTLGTYSQTVQVNAVDASSNYTIDTMGNNVAPTFVYQITNIGADNTGIMDSQVADPLYGDTWQTYLVVTVSGTNYNTILLNGFDQTYANGLSTVGVVHLSADQLTKWKVGNTYAPGYTGGETLSFGLDLSGYSGKAATMTVTAYAYCDPGFAQSHGGNLGNAKVQLSTDTVALEDTA